MIALRKSNATVLWSLLVSVLGFYYLSFHTQRYETALVIGIFALLVLNYYRQFLVANDENFALLLNAAIVFRVMLLPAWPNLSDDFYRFIWDGRLLVGGIDPYAQLPSFYMEAGNTLRFLPESLYTKLNSPEYFTVYPPVNQYIFMFAAWLFPGSVFWSMVVMKLIVVAADIANVLLIRKLLTYNGISEKKTLLYALNPLVILETAGNLHFEALMLFFILTGVYYSMKSQTLTSGIFFGLSIATKMLPLMLLPTYLKRLQWKPLVFFYGSILIVLLLISLPLFSSEFLAGMGESIGLYFNKFEFNASVYFLLRELGYLIVGYNMIGLIGKVLPAFSFVLIIIISFYRGYGKEDLLKVFVLVFTIYFFLSTTVHPWYLVTLVGLSVFTGFRYPVIWSVLIFLTYAGYDAEGFHEINWILWLEYFIVYVVFFYELYTHSNKTWKSEMD
jgi:hypothetical protein